MVLGYLFSPSLPLSLSNKYIKQNIKNDKTLKITTLNGYDAIREKLDESNTLNAKTPVEQTTKPKTKVSIGL